MEEDTPHERRKNTAISLTEGTEEGNDIELEYIDALEHNGTTYMAFFPVVEEGEEENEDEYGLIILKSETVDGEEMLANVVDEDEINEVYDLFMEQMMEDEGGITSLPTDFFPPLRLQWQLPCVVRDRLFINPHFVIRDAGTLRWFAGLPAAFCGRTLEAVKTGQRRPTCNSCAGLAGSTRPTRG